MRLARKGVRIKHNPCEFNFKTQHGEHFTSRTTLTHSHTYEAQFLWDHYRLIPSDIVALRKSAFTTTFEQPQRAGPEK